MEKILHIETATEICSVSLSDGEKIVEVCETEFDRSHAGVLTVFINNVLEKSSISVKMLDAVAVSMGPGSYTGLRIGVSVAKGICYGANLPLIAVPTLESMYLGLKKQLEVNGDLKNLPDVFIPMIDARRLEVYMAVYNRDEIQLEEIKAFIVDSNSFDSYLQDKKVCFFGNGSQKVKEIVKHKNAIYIEEFKHSSTNMIGLALKKYRSNLVEDVAYFEPFYLKEFIATVPKKNIITQADNKA
jgi:tRNA threonylcarbamoyladenosine biosynthesis protein TsaB